MNIVMHKTIYRSLRIASFLAVNALVLFGIGRMFVYLNSGADRSSIFHEAVTHKDTYLPNLTWENTENPARPIEEQALKEIKDDYLKAWYVRQLALQTNDSIGISDFYTQSARKNITNYITDNKAKGITIEATTVSHTIDLDFYSADGQVVVFTDRGVKEYQQVYKEKQLILDTEVYATYRVVMLLEDGFWKIRHLVKERYNVPKPQFKSSTITSVEEGKIFVDGVEYFIRGINYYPKETPWDMFGSEFDLDIIANDFEVIKAANLNTIRIFVPYLDFGKENVNAEKQDRLKAVLDIAEEKQLKVVVTLFDFYGNYAVQDWTFTHRHAEQIVTPLTTHKAILAWDIKNEPNLDFDSRGKTQVVAWLKEMSLQLREFDPNHLITIGWSDIQSAPILEDEVDIVSFHYYQKIYDFEPQYVQLQTQTDKPIVLQEFGVSSNKGFWSPLGISEEGQAAYYKIFQEHIQKYTIHSMPWTLYDFTKVPSSVVGKLPWRKDQQKHFGFIDKKGNEKPAFQYISNPPSP